MDPAVVNFIDLTAANVVALAAIGFIGGLVSGFIGSGGAFVLTPAMMTMGVPGAIAVASNMCHKFPKALVGAYQRYRYGHADIRLGLVMSASAAVGVWLGADIQQYIRSSYGEAGSNLYVSVAFVIVLGIVGLLVLRDAIRIYRAGDTHAEDGTSRFARWVQSIEIRGTMMHFRTANVRVSALFTIPLGFATGMLAATIAVGGFIGVPGMIYVLGVSSLVASATELVIAFVMGLGGSIKYALHGLIDIRLTLILLGGSLFGIRLGAIGTTYVRPYLIKVVMAVIMLIVAASRALVVPVHVSELGGLALEPGTVAALKSASLVLLVLALLTGGVIIIGAMLRGYRRIEPVLEERPETATE